MRLILVFLLILPMIGISQQNEENIFQNDRFVSTAFGSNLSVKRFISKHGKNFQISKKPVLNTHDDKITDTLYTFKKEATIIEIYHSKSMDIVQSATINSNLIDIGSGIKIGQPKQEVLRKLKLKTTHDSFQVGDLEGGSIYTFEFINGLLNKVKFEGYVD